jgi:hypothetical protein
MPLILDSIVFGDDDYSVPERVPFGGKHSLACHKLIGGQRVIDAMGPDDDPIKWSGRFQGSYATAKGRAVDALRSAGQPVLLTWDQFVYTVVVEDAKLNFERPYQVLYEITCMVESSPGGLFGFASTLDGLISADLGVLSSLVVGFAAAA